MSAKDTRTISLSSKELEGAIDVLSNVQALQLTRFERLSYLALMVSADLLVLSFFVSIIWPFVFGPFPVREEMSTSLLVYLNVYRGVVLVGVVSLVLNIPLFRKTFRERARLKQLGLSSLSQSLWKESWRSRWVSRVRGGLLIVIGILSLVSAFFVFAMRVTAGNPGFPGLFYGQY